MTMTGCLKVLVQIDTLFPDMPKDLNLAIFVLKCGHSFDADEREVNTGKQNIKL